MKKVIGVVAVIAITLLFGGYYVTGMLTQKNLTRNINALNNSKDITVAIDSYQRGFFKSEVTLNWTFKSPSRVIEKNGEKIFKPSSTYNVSMPLTIHHGPIILQNYKIRLGLGAASSDINLPKEYDAKFYEMYAKDSTKPKLNLDVFVGFTGNTILNLEAPKFKLVSKSENDNFEWSGMKSYINVAKNLKTVKGQVNIDGLVWVKDKFNSSIKSLESNYDLYKSDMGLYVGDASLSLPSALVLKESNKFIELDKLKLISNSVIKDALFNSSFKATLDKLFIDNETYNSCTLNFYIRNLDAKVLSMMNDKISKSENKSDRDKQLILLSLLPEIPNLVNKGAEIEISDFNVAMTDGRIRGNLLISMPKASNINPFQLLQQIKGDGRVEISNKLLQTLLKNAYIRRALVGKCKLVVDDNVAKIASDTQTTDGKTSNQSYAMVVDGQCDNAALNGDSDDAALDTANKAIAGMLEKGFLVAQGSDYVIDLQLLQGRFLVNRKPINASMLQL
jgi:uncharacterized protein YdgA (DUF945 family)